MKKFLLSAAIAATLGSSVVFAESAFDGVPSEAVQANELDSVSGKAASKVSISSLSNSLAYTTLTSPLYNSSYNKTTYYDAKGNTSVTLPSNVAAPKGYTAYPTTSQSYGFGLSKKVTCSKTFKGATWCF